MGQKSKLAQSKSHVIQNQNFQICTYIIFISVEIIHLNCMQNNQRHYKVKQDQKDSNPIYKIIYNKIRNINKKLSQLNQLQSTEKKALTHAQQGKLAKKEELTKQLAKQEDFLAYYKELVVENNLVYDRVDDLIKISTLLTVGKRIEKERNFPEETKDTYNQIYNEIFGKSVYNGKNQLSDQIIRVYKLLEIYLDKNKYYSQCKDYMTYIKEIDQRKTNKNATNPQNCASETMHHVQQINSLIKGKHQALDQIKTNEKTRNLIIINEVVQFKQQNSKLIQQIEDLKRQLNNQSGLKILAEHSPQLEKISTSQSTLPDLDDRRKDSYTELIEEELGNYDKADQKTADFSKKSDETIKSSKRKRKNKRNNYVQTDNMRKCSEIIFETTPQSSKIDNTRKCSEIIYESASDNMKSKKMRYVQKVQ